VEDTYYATDPALDRAALRAGIDAYALSQGWRVEAVEDEEEGVLPIALAATWRRSGPGETWRARASRAGLFHPTTGYRCRTPRPWPSGGARP
jgi:lycopene beta-cyclase